MRDLPFLKTWAAAMACLVLASCGGGGSSKFTIISGSENESLEPIVQAFCKQERVTCEMKFKGSLDIGLSLRPGQSVDFDAVWPASSVWLDLYDTQRQVRDAQSIYQTPVILGVRKSKAESLNWVGKPVAMKDILKAVDSGKLTYLMTSATQSNSGASAYMAMVASSLGKSGDVLTVADLDKQQARDPIRKLLKGVARSSGSSGWLKDLYLSSLERGETFDAMWNYEAVLFETNAELKSRRAEQLYAIYPSDGATMADAPFGYVDHGQSPETRSFFDKLQAHLLDPKVQAEIAKLGRRIPLGRATAGKPDTSWNFDPSRLVTVIPPQEPAVIAKALNLYQEVLRKPSLTALCLDYSGSMEGDGINQLRDGLDFLFTPAKSAEQLVQWGGEDRVIVLRFSGDVDEVIETGTSSAEQTTLLTTLLPRNPDGGTNMYACGREALKRMQPLLATGRYLPAIVMMTDGRSDDHFDSFIRDWQRDGHKVPVFGVTFGDIQEDQLKALAEATQGRVFSGSKGLASAFRSTRGYN